MLLDAFRTVVGHRRRIVAALATSIALMIAVVSARTATYGEVQPVVVAAPPVAVPAGASERLAAAIRIRTISHEDPAAFDPAAFRALHAHLEASFPRVHSQLERETVASHSLLYTWRGSDPSLEAVLLMGHLDVVPVEPGTETKWHEDPFGGRIADGFIWGRGAIDNKSAVVGILEAVEMLLAEEFRPARTIHIAFGHDEEVGGSRGARQVAALLRGRGARLEMVIDEGGVIGERILPGVSAPVAMVGIAEKGFVSIELATRVPGGHSSLPPPQSAIGILSAAIARLESHPMAARLEAPTRQLFERLGPELPVARRAAFANLWLTRPFVMGALESSPGTNAMVRTTAAVTIFQAGTKDNVLPSEARAVVNFRILPGDTVASVVDHVRAAIADARVSIETVGRFSAEPSTISSTDSDGFRKLERTIRSAAPGTIVAPFQVVVVTDARHFADLSRNVFRFLPVRLEPDDLARMHGTDERIAIRDYELAITIYRQLILNVA